MGGALRLFWEGAGRDAESSVKKPQKNKVKNWQIERVKKSGAGFIIKISTVVHACMHMIWGAGRPALSLRYKEK